MNNSTKDIIKLKEAIGRIVANIEKDEHESNTNEIEEEIFDELSRDLGVPRQKKGKIGLGLKLARPTPNAIVSYEIDGKTVKTVFEHDDWKIFRLGEYVTFRFRQKSEARSYDLTGKLSEILVMFFKDCSWFMLPGNSLGLNVKSARTSLNNMDYFRYFISLLMEWGYLLNIDNVEPKPLYMLNVNDLKTEIRKRMEENVPATCVAGLFRAVGKWVQMADYVNFPAEFMPSFNIRDWQGDKVLLKQVCRYEAERITPWKDIPHDDLIRLLQESQVYIQNFSDDILFMRSMFEKELVNLSFKNDYQKVSSIGRTKHIFSSLINHKFVMDPRTGKPWFSVHAKESTFKRGKSVAIGASKSGTEKGRLVNCCIFLLLLWTAARVEEVTHFKVDGLLINGQKLEPKDNAVEIYKQAMGPQGVFKPKIELEFLTFKTSKSPKGKLRKIPMTPDAAHAFCILIELFRDYRVKFENPYLFPTGVMRPGIGRKSQAPVNTGYMNYHLDKLCKKIGIEYHHPHRCRKTLPTIMINKNPNSLDLIQRLLGHNTPTMTLRYLMKLPGISEPIRQHIITSNRMRILDLLTSAATRRMAGQAAEHMMKEIPPEKLVAEVLPDTIEEYLEVLLSDPNFVIINTPAAWCLRLQSLRPQQLPCLPDIRLVDTPPEDLVPIPSNCRPWQCGYAAHTQRHLSRARDNRDASKRLAGSAGVRSALVQSFSPQAEYWENVVRHLEQGHHDFQEMVPAVAFNSVL